MCDKNGISRGVGGGGLFCELILENPEGMEGHRQNTGGGMDISWNYTLAYSVVL